MTAVQKLSIAKPGTTKDIPQSRTTLIRKAVTPKVIMDRGIKIICKTGLIKVFTTPTTTAVTIKAWVDSKENPGTR